MAKIDTTVSELVQRSRLGDQVATATITVVADQARRGDTKAEQVRQKILKYCEQNPIRLDSHMSFFGVESPPAREAAVMDAITLRQNLHTGRFTDKGLAVLLLSLGKYATGILFHGPSLLPDEEGPSEILIAARDALVGEDCKAAFDCGNKLTNQPELLQAQLDRMTPPQKKACHLGILLGRARRLQAVAQPRVPLKILCAETAWELGE